MIEALRDIGRTRLPRLLAALLVFALACPAGATVDARLDRGKVYEGDVFTLIIDNTGQQGGNPDLSVLNQDFEVLGTGTSSQFSIVNGRSSSRTSWTVRLRPLRLGTLAIPPIPVGSEKTRPLTVEVVEVPETVGSQQNAHAFIEVEIAHDGPVYVQQQLAYTVRLYQDERVSGGELSPPRAQGALIEQLGGDGRYTVTRNGRTYRVTERRYAIAAEKSGELRIAPVAFRGRLAPAKNNAPSGGRRSPFGGPFFGNGPFANDPFFSNGPFPGDGQPLRVSSKAITLDIQPPQAAAGRYWLPAESLSLHDSWADNPPTLRSGEPVSRVITIRAKGLNGSQLPALELHEPAQTRVYPGNQARDTRSDGGAVYGISRQTFSYIPGRDGRLVIPPVELTWWNTTSHQPQTTRLAPWELDVAAGATGGQGAPLPPPARQAGDDAPAAARQDAGADDGGWSVLWWLLPAGLLLIAAIRLTAAIRGRRRKTATAPARAAPEPAVVEATTAPVPDVRELRAELESACMRNEPHAAAHALLALGSRRWPESPPANVRDLGQRLGHGETAIDWLDRALYAPGGQAWAGAGLWDIMKSVDWKPPKAEEKPRESGLQPLYPHKA